VVCITHYSLEYIGNLPYPEIEAILDAYALIKGNGKSSKRAHGQRASHEQIDPDMPLFAQQALSREKNKDEKRNRIRPEMFPLTVQQQMKELRKKAKRD
jgi:hypothetical protein